jgi:hypothetical protein
MELGRHGVRVGGPRSVRTRCRSSRLRCRSGSRDPHPRGLDRRRRVSSTRAHADRRGFRSGFRPGTP